MGLVFSAIHFPASMHPNTVNGPIVIEYSLNWRVTYCYSDDFDVLGFPMLIYRIDCGLPGVEGFWDDFRQVSPRNRHYAAGYGQRKDVECLDSYYGILLCGM